MPDTYSGRNEMCSQENFFCTTANKSRVESNSIHGNQVKPCPEFNFRHKFSLLVVSPTKSGKTYFVQQILENNRIVYEEQKIIRIFWYYNQWQECYEKLKKSLGKSIRFQRGVPELSEDLCEINPRYNNIIILDDLMAEAADSPVVSRLFTQGRQRNASVILLLQNMFSKGKYNTDISRNAQYLALFRSPSDRKQIGIIGERMFDKNRMRKTIDSQYSEKNYMESHTEDNNSIRTEERDENSSEEEQSSIPTEDSSEEEIDPWSTLINDAASKVRDQYADVLQALLM